MYLNLSYRSIFDHLDEALTKKTLIVTNRKTRRIGKTEALVHLAKIKELPIVVKDIMVNGYTKEYPNVRIIGETTAEKSHLLNTVLIEEGVQEKTITILRDKGVTVSGFLVDMNSFHSSYEELKDTTIEEQPLLQITLKELDSVPEVIHNGESLQGRIDIDFNWKTGGYDKAGSTYINLRTAGNKGKKPSERRIEYKRGEAMDDLPTKDDLVWDKERGVYIRPWKNMTESTVQ
ncbi:hypothetical protein [Bacillus pumilus]|uniref:hypothetical protein n=1 Tax=Bacillus pumilus TaxID=1408 RepID=UPI00380C91A3